MFKKILKHKKGGWLRSISIQGIMAFLALSLVATFIINWLLNQIFGVKMLELGTPVRVFIFLVSLTLVFWVFINKGGRLNKADVLTIGVIAICSGILIYYLPVLLPELYAIPFIQSAYTNPNSPLAIWYNASSVINTAVQSII